MTLDLTETPIAKEMYMLVGWRQWADAGLLSSGLPQYLVQRTDARRIGGLRPDGFYIFQIPGTHDLVRPTIKLSEGLPQTLHTQRNEFYFTGDRHRGMVIFIGDEPHMDAERYCALLIQAARMLNVKRIIAFGGIYGEMPYDKERLVTAIYSLPRMKNEMQNLAVNLSNYQGGASIGSYLCKRAGEHGIEFTGFYSFVPAYDFSGMPQVGSAIRVETDYTAWLGIMRRVNYMLQLEFDLTDLEEKSKRLMQTLDARVSEMDSQAPQAGVREFLRQLSAGFTETPFNPLGEVWEEELRRLFRKYDGEGS